MISKQPKPPKESVDVMCPKHNVAPVNEGLTNLFTKVGYSPCISITTLFAWIYT